MDFAFSEEQTALAELASKVFTDHVTHDRLRDLERAAGEGAVHDPTLWAACAQAGLLGATIPEAHGGAGMGLLELLPVLEAMGRSVAPIPLVETLVLGAAAMAAFGSQATGAAWLPGVATGDVVLTVAFNDAMGGAPDQPVASVTGTRTPDGWELRGTAPFVNWAGQADRVLLPIADGDGVAILLLDPYADGVEVEALHTTNRQPQAHLHLADVSVPTAEVLVDGAAGAQALRWLAQRGAAAWAAVQAGVCEGAVAMMATYTSTRHQFDKPIAEFQAVAQRAADAFIDAEMIRLTARLAVYRLSQGLDAQQEVHVAKFWAGDGAMRVVHAAQHLHGGIGVDLDYPLHRYFLWAKRIEHTLGTPTRELIRLGALLADEPV